MSCIRVVFVEFCGIQENFTLHLPVRFSLPGFNKTYHTKSSEKYIMSSLKLTRLSVTDFSKNLNFRVEIFVTFEEPQSKQPRNGYRRFTKKKCTLSVLIEDKSVGQI